MGSEQDKPSTSEGQVACTWDPARQIKPLVNKGGRPKGSRNKDTLFKEMMTLDFQNIAKKDIKKIYKILFEKAQGGDMKAIKVILDRVVPVTKAIDLEDLEKGGLQININVGAMEQDPIDVDFVEVIE